MIVTLINRERITSITLPEKVSGQYWLNDVNDPSKRLISIEGINGKWVIKSNNNVKVLDNRSGKPIRNTVINPMSIYHLSINGYENKSFVFTERNTEDRQTYIKKLVKKNTEIHIGRNEKNDIVIKNRFVSAHHATLSFYEGEWRIVDHDSTNGTFINGRKVKYNQKLHIGDVVYIMGFKIIIGNVFIALNNPDGLVTIQSQSLSPFINQPVVSVDEDEDEEIDISTWNFFYRSPRFKRDIKTAQFKIDPPPQNAIGDEMPIMLAIGPSMTMGMASLATALFAINNAMLMGDITRAMPSIIMSASMLLGTVMWPIVSKKYEQRRKRKKEKIRQEKYKRYLEKFEVLINEEMEKQAEILHENFVPITEVENRIQNVQRNLWERGMGQNDFLRLRIGIGDGLLDAEITSGDKKFSIEEDNLQEELRALIETPKILKDIPITLSFFENHITGVIGTRSQVVEFAKGLVFQFAGFYGYDEVKLIFIYDENEEGEFGFTKWLPHVWSDDHQFRFIGTNKNEVKEISAYIEKEIEKRLQINDSQFEDVSPYYVIFALSKQLANRVEMLKQIYSKKKNLHISVITFYDELQNLPKECTMVVELEDDRGRLFDKNDITGKSISFKPDIFLTTNPEELSIKLANIRLDTSENSNNLPSMVTFLEMFGVGKVEHLNALTRWKDNDPTKSLETPIGVDSLGEHFKLDLHERFHGPHGLVAGMTGSGKSEFIITYILSLAVNYHPNEVAFIFIDYKGGGMAKAFESLPHTAGIITNLDGSAIKRSLISIESELKRRQTIFTKASKKIGESNIDIYKYQRLYREGVVNEPLQHLFIIADEFAELKTQQPDFMQQLISAARIGRSLGVHLILATQKPSGVVDDQIWSNSKFRICLKVQERADSMDMIKRPDAAELTDTGRFYLQVGYNELFEIGQSAWAGAPYYPADKVVVEKDDSVVVIDRNGRPIKTAKMDKKKNVITKPRKQMDVIVEYLEKIAKEEGISIRPLWLKPLPAVILLDEIKKKYPEKTKEPLVLNPVIGEYDDPARQRQDILRLPLTKEGNVIVYGAAGSGKTTFINAMVYSLLKEHTPDEVNIYLLDFSSETLRAFAKAPHVGDVVLSYENEKIHNLFKMVKDELKHRKKIFADYGGDLLSYYNATNKKIPSIVIVINNYAAFIEQYEEQEDMIAFLTREGTKYGIYFVLTALGTNAVRYRLMQNFKQLIVLQLNDESEYSTIIGKTEGLLPSKIKGRGLIRRDNLYEFQTAHITNEPNPFHSIQRTCEKLKQNWSHAGANRIPILPEKVDSEFLAGYVKAEQLTIPIGVEKNSLKVHDYPFGNFYINLILSNGTEFEPFIGELSILMAKWSRLDVTVIDPPKSLKEKVSKKLSYYSTSKELETIISSLFDLTVYRNNTYKESMEKGKEIEGFEQKVIIINSIVNLKSSLSDEGIQKLDLILEKGQVDYNMTFLITEQSGKLSGDITFSKWYKQHINGLNGIWIGDGITEQFQLKPSKITMEMRDETGEGFGFSLLNGKGVKVKLLGGGMEENRDE